MDPTLTPSIVLITDFLQHADLTDFSTFAEIWLAKEDEDERNSKLAEVLWVENGLDLPEDFVGLLLTFLGRFDFEYLDEELID